MTNLHVVENAETIKITLSDQTEYSAELVGSDRLTDMAVLKIDSETPLPYAEFGNSESARVGDWVIAIGDPFGLSPVGFSRHSLGQGPQLNTKLAKRSIASD